MSDHAQCQIEVENYRIAIDQLKAERDLLKRQLTIAVEALERLMSTYYCQSDLERKELKAAQEALARIRGEK